MMDEENKLIELIKSDIKKKNMSLTQYASTIGITRQTLSAVIDQGKISFETCVMLQPVLKMPLVNILRMSELIPPAKNNTEQHDYLIYSWNSMSDENRKALIKYIQFLMDEE